MSLVALATGVLVWGPAAAADVVLRTESGQARLVEVARGLDTPWAMAFLPDGRLLLTERPGRMRLVAADGTVSEPLAGVPEVHARGQGGLLDVALSPHFATDRTIVFSFAQPTASGARTAVARARLDAEALRLDDVTVIFSQNEDPSGNHHWGSRLVFDREGRLFVTLGDRFHSRDRAQALDSHLGKIVRIGLDGSVPGDNPFVRQADGDAKAQPEIWSYGHRNVQGAALDPLTGELWAHEHGPQGGDELNRVLPGRNYGWPVITFGREYVIGTRIGEGTARADVEPPLKQWTPSIAPSGMAFYTGDAFPQWKGNLFVGALKFQLLARLVLEGGKVVHEERLDIGKRIRDVRQGPDGRLWLLDESDGRVLRLDPA
ncbi:PQQ-dependent sugar dehydrogenase [Thauera linaloolentis]|uniref:Glucose sorbosone dehydrogenase n=1 Tax=Thauera linaloolentis (strain DSM 12138 / JCM 21573 / CCUG 41526 / CIP 105981 / IAM 15112 / NBRC 102519 / 47Lol) TaxID=1123367 RepID=N6Z9T4_THAL4|nr:PQQ-dependent sugar dehydrogenase [Thauera linaloolentis]ENO88889.1 glucose sorbosone dehydrogenase [Thauera linaloolentis 47Lol = DSM 12138]MCM8564816.1 PQQ-dependent sugar dehydrogenase [Thauera linaloolentis]